jgi:hypothetical protein
MWPPRGFLVAKEKTRPDPPVPRSPWVFRGGVCLLLGFTILAMSDVAFASLAVDMTVPADTANQRYLAIAGVYAAGEVLIGLGFFLALFGFSRRPSPQA